MAAADLIAGEAPGAPPSRHDLLRALARAASPILRGEEARACLAGPPGSGKSALLRELLPELHRAAAERGLRLPVYFVDGRSAGTAYALLAALVRLAGGEAPATGWSWGRLVEAWRARVPGPAAVALDHADEATGVERLLRILARDSPLGLVVAARSGSDLARKWGTAVPAPGGFRPPPGVPLEFPGSWRWEAGGAAFSPAAVLPSVAATPPVAAFSSVAVLAPSAAPPSADALPSASVLPPREVRLSSAALLSSAAAPPPPHPSPLKIGGVALLAASPVQMGVAAATPVPPRTVAPAPSRNSTPTPFRAATPAPLQVAAPTSSQAATPIPSPTAVPAPPQAATPLPSQAATPVLPRERLEPPREHPQRVPDVAPSPGGQGRRGGPGLLQRVQLLDDPPRLLLALLAREERLVTTGHLWSAYRRAAPESGLRPLTLRRISGLLRELEDAGLVSAPIVNRGRRGRTKWAALTDGAREALQEGGVGASS